MSTRTRRNHFKYATYIKNRSESTCQFCELTNKDTQIIKETSSFWIIKNIFPYDVWDTAGVNNHLLIVPKRHVDSIAHFNDTESKDFVKQLATYEQRGFSVYARAANNSLKSVVHQHTHLIAIDNKIKKYILFSKKPRFLFTK